MTNAEEQYQDIIHQSRPINEVVLLRYPRMKLSERAKIFSPFSALRGLDGCLDAEDQKLLRQERIELNEEDSLALSEALTRLQKGAAITVTYFIPESEDETCGCYRTVSGTILGIEPILRLLRLDCREERDLKRISTLVPFDRILRIE